MTTLPRTWDRTPAGQGVVYGMALAIGLALFYRDAIATGWDLLPGNEGDTRFVLVNLEHWRLAFQGKADWDSMLMFYPLRHTLAMSDLHFLMGLPYTAFRLLGWDMFASFQATLVTLSIVGFACMAALLNQGLRCRPSVAAVGALLFTANINMFFEANHPQLMMVALVPLVFLLALKFLEPVPTGAAPPVAAAVAFIVLEGGLVCTAFYIGWAVVWVMALVAGIHALKLKRGRRWREVWRILLAPLERCGRWNVLFLALLAAIGGFFLWTYAPVIAEYGGRRYTDLFHTLPTLAQLMDISPSNWLWANVLHRLLPAAFDPPAPVRPWNGLPPAMFLGFLWALAYWRWGRRAASPAPAEPLPVLAPPRIWAGTLGLAVLLGWLLMLRVGKFSLWIVPFNLFPGANGLRVAGRLQLILIIPVIAVLALTVNDLWTRAAAAPGGRQRRWLWAVLPLGAALLIAEQTFAGPIGGFGIASQRALLRRMGRPPAECRVFQMEPFAATDRPGVFYQGDAIVIAYALQLPTVHGFTGVQLKSHKDLDPWSPGYAERVAQWWASNGITSGICAVDLASGRWRVVK